MKIGFIGAGKVGTSMGIFFKNHHLHIAGYYSRREITAQFAAQSTASQFFSDIPTLIGASDLVFITTGDDQIAAVIDQLAQSSALTKKHTLVHASGALSTDIFAPIKETGCGLCSLHPIMSFSDIDKAAENLKDTVFTMEGNHKGLEDIKALLDTTGSDYFIIQKEHKVLYHGAACILSNYLVTLMDAGFELLKSAGIEDEAISRAFMPLISATLGNIEKSRTVNALTGPLVRGDENTIKAHIAAIKKDAPDFLNLYEAMGIATIEMIKDKRLDLEKYTQLKKILAS